MPLRADSAGRGRRCSLVGVPARHDRHAVADRVVAYRLQEGDPEGHVRRVLARFLGSGGFGSSRRFGRSGRPRSRRGFDGLAFGNLTGQAVFVGPTFYAALGKGASLSGAWNIQVWGQATGLDPGLDLTLFQRQMFKLRLAIDL